MGIIELIKKYDDLYYLKGVNMENIRKAEEELQLSFSEDYILYLSEFGVASFNGKELTGLVDSKRLNVVDVTKNYRRYNELIPSNLYVIENINIDNIVIMQDKDGIVYEAVGKQSPTKIFDSLNDYLLAD
ncbi:MAG: SMI1/KNR4 family protein [Lachnospiraceae bacterium]|nr:SMI1/KNR4 family protein [Lachnospiraceae bacterium]